MSARRVAACLAALERVLGLPPGACPACTPRPEAPIRVTSEAWGDPPAAPCPQCGREPIRVTISLEKPRGEDEPADADEGAP